MRRDRQEYQRYFREIADRMQLQNWTITIEPVPPGDAADYAEVLRTKGRRVALIRLSELFLNSSEEDQRDTAVHELIHLQGAFVDSFIRGQLDEEEWATYNNLREYEVDSQAAAFAPLMPLPGAILDDIRKEQPRKHPRKR